MIDEVKLKRAFAELIENSVDFQPTGGMLSIRTGIADAETVRVFGRGLNPHNAPVVQVEFIDHGPGLSEQDRERVFTPFYTRKAKGMGLGLSIVKGIIEAHKGTIHEIGDRDAGGRDASGRELSPRVVGRGATGAHFLILLPNPPHRPEAA
jgi:signal transduction histidine kinase